MQTGATRKEIQAPVDTVRPAPLCATSTPRKTARGGTGLNRAGRRVNTPSIVALTLGVFMHPLTSVRDLDRLRRTVTSATFVCDTPRGRPITTPDDGGVSYLEWMSIRVRHAGVVCRSAFSSWPTMTSTRMMCSKAASAVDLVWVIAGPDVYGISPLVDLAARHVFLRQSVVDEVEGRW